MFSPASCKVSRIVSVSPAAPLARFTATTVPVAKSTACSALYAKCVRSSSTQPNTAGRGFQVNQPPGCGKSSNDRAAPLVPHPLPEISVAPANPPPAMRSPARCPSLQSIQSVTGRVRPARLDCVFPPEQSQKRRAKRIFWAAARTRSPARAPRSRPSPPGDNWAEHGTQSPLPWAHLRSPANTSGLLNTLLRGKSQPAPDPRAWLSRTGLSRTEKGGSQGRQKNPGFGRLLRPARAPFLRGVVSPGDPPFHLRKWDASALTGNPAGRSHRRLRAEPGRRGPLQLGARVFAMCSGMGPLVLT